jgi:putative peptidoglycan lipid II flippase
MRQPIVTLMLEYGKFGERSTAMVSWALLWYAAGLVGHCIVEILARAFYALHDTRTPVVIGVTAMGLNVAFSFWFSALFERVGWLPHGGLALANSLATALEAITLWILMTHRLDGLDNRRVFRGIWQALAGCTVMGLAIWIWLTQMESRSAWIVGLGGVALGGILYGCVLLLLKVDETRILLRIFRRFKWS